MNDNSDSMLLDGPRGLAFSSDNNYLYVSSSFTDEILRYDAATGDFVDQYISPHYGEISVVSEPVFGLMAMSMLQAATQMKFLRYDATTGDFLDKFIPWNKGLDGPRDLTFSLDKTNLFVSNFNTNEILRYDVHHR